MANDPNLALVTFRFPTPSSTFPLAGAVTAVGVGIARPAIPTPIAVGYTRTWGGANPVVLLHNQGSEQSLFPPSDRTGDVGLLNAPVGSTVVAAVMTRQWNGIGGIGYLPSFPQLERHVTTWPHAT